MPPWIFIHDTDKVEEGLMVLFFGLVFSVRLLPENFFTDALGSNESDVNSNILYKAFN